ncbi:TPA: IS3 family transposase [Bacillus cereus]
MKTSMSRTGDFWYNDGMENFFSHFKIECFHLISFRKVHEVKLAMRKYIFL